MRKGIIIALVIIIIGFIGFFTAKHYLGRQAALKADDYILKLDKKFNLSMTYKTYSYDLLNQTLILNDVKLADLIHKWNAEIAYLTFKQDLAAHKDHFYINMVNVSSNSSKIKILGFPATQDNFYLMGDIETEFLFDSSANALEVKNILWLAPALFELKLNMSLSDLPKQLTMEESRDLLKHDSSIDEIKINGLNLIFSNENFISPQNKNYSQISEGFNIVTEALKQESEKIKDPASAEEEKYSDADKSRLESTIMAWTKFLENPQKLEIGASPPETLAIKEIIAGLKTSNLLKLMKDLNITVNSP